LDDFKVGDKAIFIEPDTLVDCKLPQFIFLDNHERIKVRKFRGVISQGLLIKAPSIANVGDNYWDALMLQHYDPELTLTTGGDNEVAPNCLAPQYDVENLTKYPDVFDNLDYVNITAKIHGTSARFVYWDNKMHVGSRATWKRESDSSVYWKAFKLYPGIEAFCKEYPGFVVYGEVYGPKIQNLTYGIKQGSLAFAAFDVFDSVHTKSFLKPLAIREVTENKYFPWVHCYHSKILFNLDMIKELAELDDPIAKKNNLVQLTEGIVVRSIVERHHPEIGRCILKQISNRYYLQK
jgi:RNA ligase (TIGR02306 family)